MIHEAGARLGLGNVCPGAAERRKMVAHGVSRGFERCRFRVAERRKKASKSINVCRVYSASSTFSNSSANHWPERPAVLSRMALTCSALTSGALLPHSLRTYVNTSAIC